MKTPRSTDLDPCTQAQELLEALVDGEIPPLERQRVLDHAGQCPRCARHLALAQRIREELRALPEPTLELEPGLPAVPPTAWLAPSHGWHRWVPLGVLALALGGAWAMLQRTAREVAPVPLPTAQVVRAEQEARFALAKLGEVSRRSGLALRDEVLGPRLIGTTTASLAASFDHVSRGETP